MGKRKKSLALSINEKKRLLKNENKNKGNRRLVI